MKEHLDTIIEHIKKLPVVGSFFEPKPKVYAVRFSGVISDASRRKEAISHNRYIKIIEKIFEKKDLKAFAMIINSPGGSPAQSSLIASHIRRLADEKEIPVLAFTEDVAASGGYWLACAADEIYAQETSIVGSIGVVSASFGFEDFIEKHNIHRRLHTSGEQKSFLDPFSPEKETDLARLKTIQNDIHTSFIDWVRERRGDRITGKDKELFEGQFWTAGTAIANGTIDGLGDVRVVTKEKYGEEVKVVDISPEKKVPFPLSMLARYDGASLPDDVMDMIEGRSLWARFGL